MPRPSLSARILLAVAFAATATTTTIAAPPPEPDPVDFVRDVRPLFDRHCIACHGPEKQKSGFRLDVKSEAFAGGDAYGPAIVPGDAAESPLIQLVTGEDEPALMPPKSDRLSDAEIRTLTRWINQGAPWPESADRVTLDDPRDHWAFQPLTRPEPPRPTDPAWSRGDIDRFILARLEHSGLVPAPEADRATWLRRVALDLTGLRPTYERISDFITDERPDAHERAVDELLASPRHGERWARHWLDVVRYADTHGFEVNTERPNAWPYRDYVIHALNADIPYDRFVRDQIAGDATGQDAATGFLVTASVLLPGQVGQDAPSIRLARQDALDEIVTNAGLTFLGLSIGCARCHDHKFDPISQADYYAMQGFFAGVEYGDRPLQTPEAKTARAAIARLRSEQSDIDRKLAGLVPRARSGTERPMIHPRINTDRFDPVSARRVRFTILATNRLEPCVDELEVFDIDGRNVALAAAGTSVKSSGDTVVPDRHELRFVNDGLHGNSHSWMSSATGAGWVELEFPREITIDRVVWGRDRDGTFRDRLPIEYRIEIATDSADWKTVADSTDRIKFDENRKPPAKLDTRGLTDDEAREATQLTTRREAIDAEIARAEASGLVAFAGIFRDPDTIHRLHRGDPEQPKEIVEPAIPRILGAIPTPMDSSEQGRRLALASWIADPGNPLTARVMVNRIWQGHFGIGLVPTPSDLGRNGVKPSHPELLDWLASEFIRSGWSIKHMHRLIVLSSAYRQSSRIDRSARAVDADSRLLWRFPSRRLEAEAIRDTMLAASGRLNLEMGGPGFNLFTFRGGLQGFPPIESFPPEGRRRMIYAHKVRRERDAVFGAFDCPDAGQSTARRIESTTPIQALNLFNSRFTLDESAATAALIATDVGDDPDAQTRHAYRRILGRDPAPDEVADAAPVVRTNGLATLCRALFNSNEFLYIP